MQLARNRKITGESLRVFMVILATIDSGLFSPVSIREIAEELSLHRRSVGRALDVLEKEGVIKKRFAAGKLIGFEVIEYFGAASDPFSHERAVQRQPQQEDG